MSQVRILPGAPDFLNWIGCFQKGRFEPDRVAGLQSPSLRKETNIKVLRGRVPFGQAVHTLGIVKPGGEQSCRARKFPARGIFPNYDLPFTVSAGNLVNSI